MFAWSRRGAARSRARPEDLLSPARSPATPPGPRTRTRRNTASPGTLGVLVRQHGPAASRTASLTKFSDAMSSSVCAAARFSLADDVVDLGVGLFQEGHAHLSLCGRSRARPEWSARCFGSSSSAGLRPARGRQETGAAGARRRPAPSSGRRRRRHWRRCGRRENRAAVSSYRIRAHARGTGSP